MLKPSPPADVLARPIAVAVLMLAIALSAGTMHAQSTATGPQNNKRIASINFGTNGSDPDRRDPKERILQGKVQDSNGKAIKGAIVYLKDKHDDSVKSIVADDSGAYRFAQLSQNRDYEVWAQFDKKKGVLKQISSFDDRAEIMLNLKIE
jgi:hypothetical protein